MKTLVKNYVFNPAAKTITISNLSSIDLEQLLIITNTTDNIIIYNFADPSLGASVLNNVITLAYNTTAMSSDDALQIFIDIPDTTNLEYLGELLTTGFAAIISELQSMKANQGLPSPDGRLRVSVNGGGYLDTLYNITSIGGYYPQLAIMSQSNMAPMMLRNNVKIYGGNI